MLYHLPHPVEELGEPNGPSVLNVHVLVTSNSSEFGILYPSLFNLADGWDDTRNKFTDQMPQADINWLTFPFTGGKKKASIDPDQFSAAETAIKALATQSWTSCTNASSLLSAVQLPENWFAWSIMNSGTRLEAHAQALGFAN
jgi:hypothetical protein